MKSNILIRIKHPQIRLTKFVAPNKNKCLCIVKEADISKILCPETWYQSNLKRYVVILTRQPETSQHKTATAFHKYPFPHRAPVMNDVLITHLHQTVKTLVKSDELKPLCISCELWQWVDIAVGQVYIFRRNVFNFDDDVVNDVVHTLCQLTLG